MKVHVTTLRRLARRARLLLLVALVPLGLAPASIPEVYESATFQDGAVRILTADHRTIVLPGGPSQVGIDQVTLSPDRHAIGWLALFSNCCAAFKIPFYLKVYSNGVLHSFVGNTLPVWRWRFEAAGTQVSLYQETERGEGGRHYELRDVRSGNLLAQFDPDTTQIPSWVLRLDVPRPTMPQ